ncbi:unnamed protein product, partial [marine sediment metagenome]
SRGTIMESDMKEVEKIIDEHKSYLKSINDGIIEGISEGVKEGVAEGLKRGVKDGLKECFTKGFVNIGQDDIQDILEDIPEEFIKNSVKEGARHILEEGTEDYIVRLCQKLVDGIRKEKVKLSKDQTGYVLGLIKRSELEAMKRMVERLPNNPFLREITAGMQTALEESLEKNLEACEERIQKEIENLERGSGRNGKSR